MATAVWPAPASPAELEVEENRALANELVWLLNALQESLAALKAGFEECAQLLAPKEQGSTLPLSSHRSECLKGIVTRVGARIVKGDMKLRLVTLPPPKGQNAYPLVVSSAPQAPTLVLPQLTDARSWINGCLDVVDAATWAGDVKDGNFISGQLRLLDVNIQAALASLKGSESTLKPWYTSHVDPSTFDPPLPPNVSFHLSIADAALVLELRTLEPVTSAAGEFRSPFDFRGTLGRALGAARPQVHDEIDEVFTHDGREVKVKEKIRVESLDPNLMAATAKLTALERNLRHARKALDIVMEKDDA